MTLYFNRHQPVAYHQQNILTNDETILSLSLSNPTPQSRRGGESYSLNRGKSCQGNPSLPSFFITRPCTRISFSFFFFRSISSEQAGSCLKGGNPNKKQAMERKRTKKVRGPWRGSKTRVYLHPFSLLVEIPWRSITGRNAVSKVAHAPAQPYITVDVDKARVKCNVSSLEWNENLCHEWLAFGLELNSCITFDFHFSPFFLLFVTGTKCSG